MEIVADIIQGRTYILVIQAVYTVKRLKFVLQCTCRVAKTMMISGEKR